MKNRIKELRLKHNYTLDDMEEKTGIKRGTYMMKIISNLHVMNVVTPSKYLENLRLKQ